VFAEWIRNQGGCDLREERLEQEWSNTPSATPEISMSSSSELFIRALPQSCSSELFLKALPQSSSSELFLLPS